MVGKQDENEERICMVMPILFRELGMKRKTFRCACRNRPCPCNDLIDKGVCDCHVFLDVTDIAGAQRIFREAAKKVFEESKRAVDEGKITGTVAFDG